MAAGFDVATQDAGTINNVGGDQHVHLSQARRRLARVAKAMTFVALCVTIAALAALGFACYATVENVRAAIDADSLGAPYLDYAPSYWTLAVGGLVGGIVFGKLGRVLSL
jgi:hypothetical protein